MSIFNNDLIRRSDVLKGKEIHYSFNGVEIIEGEAVSVEYINNIPSVDVQKVKHGHWIKTEYGWSYCSNCLSKPLMDFSSYYCPWCGAEMDEKKE